MKKRDLLDGSALLRRHKIDVDPVSASLAAKYISDRRDGVEAAAVSFDEWLDSDVDDEDVGDLVGADEPDSDPT
jgi:hypothetical protein